MGQARERQPERVRRRPHQWLPRGLHDGPRPHRAQTHVIDRGRDAIFRASSEREESALHSLPRGSL